METVIFDDAFAEGTFRIRSNVGVGALPTRARVQVHRFWSVLALHEWVPRVMDYRSPALFTREEISHMRIWSAG